MARNVEIKARADDLRALEAKVAALASEGPITLTQDDTFFAGASGRLKLRAFASDRGELIFYRRNDETGPKESFYVRSPTAQPDTLRETLALAYGETGRVRKRRIVYLVGRSRVHLDRVEGLGDFVEIEVVLGDGESAGDGVREAHALMAKLGIDASRLVAGAYFDLLTRAEAAR